MIERVFDTTYGPIRYWTNSIGARKGPQLVFLPGLTADHSLFDKQIEFFEGRYPVFVWDAPGHASSYPFEMSFSLEDKARWLNDILTAEGFNSPIIVGQSMGGYL